MAVAVEPTRSPAGTPPGVAALLDRLDGEQRAAALLPDGPAQIIAPAGSGKTTTLVARLGVLLGRGVSGERIAVVTFNREAAAELSLRIERQLVPHIPSARGIEVRTLHGLGRQVLLDAGCAPRILADRGPLLRRARRAARRGRHDALPEVGELDTAVSAWKVEGREPSQLLARFVREYERLRAESGQMDFDDLLVDAVLQLERDRALRARWQARFSHVLVDEFQDVDAVQLRLVRLLAEPDRNLFVVGDDDQTIYAWRLADVRRMLDFRAHYPDARTVVLATNYRCPAEVVGAATRLIEHNRERFSKPIRSAMRSPDRRASPGDPVGALSSDIGGWERGVVAEAVRASRRGRVAVLARTEGELVPVRVALVRARVRHASRIATPLDAAPSVELLTALRGMPADGRPFPALLQARSARGWRRQDELLSDEEQRAVDALLSWAPAHDTIGGYLAAADRAREAVDRLSDPAARIELLTVHAAKGREWPTVILLGMERDRFPNRRAILGSASPARAIEEERRLAYVAFTRATRSLVLVVDPSRPSRFLGEAGLGVRER